MEMILEDLPLFALGTYYTLYLTVVSLLLGLMIGLGIALIRVFSQNAILIGLSKGYISIIRGTPLLVQLFILYYGLPDIGVKLSPMTASILALSINTGAFLSETFRSSILSVKRGQLEAALSLGLKKWQAFYFIIMPQAARVAIPPMGNTFIGMLKETSLVSVVTVTELLRTSQLLIAKHLVVMPFYISIAVIYWVLSAVFSIILVKVENRLSFYEN
jgi:L-cystine transport system permease protein